MNPRPGETPIRSTLFRRRSMSNGSTRPTLFHVLRKEIPWLSIHGGRMFRINRKTGPKIIRSNNPAVSICGGIQPLVLQRIVDENKDFFESGLTARILFAMPPDKPTYWTEATTSDEALLKYENIFRTLHRWRTVPGAPSPEHPLIVRLSPEAKDLFVRFYNSNADERIELQGDMKAAWAKFAGYAARLALVIHLVERIEDGGPMEILPGDVMQRAIRLVLWFKREAARILKLLRNTKCEIDFEAQSILEAVEKNGGTITVRELQHRRNKYRGKEGTKNVTTILNGLVQQGKLTSAPVPSANGKEVVCYGLPYRSAATNTGDWSAATVSGKGSVAICTGANSKAKASLGSAITLVEHDDEGNISCIKSGIAGKDIEPDVYYKLIDGEFVKTK